MTQKFSVVLYVWPKDFPAWIKEALDSVFSNTVSPCWAYVIYKVEIVAVFRLSGRVKVCVGVVPLVMMCSPPHNYSP